MTSKERWLAVLNRQPTDRVPTAYWATAEATAKLKDYLNYQTLDEVFQQLHIDQVILVRGKYVGPELEDDQDVFGCRSENVPYETGAYVFHGAMDNQYTLAFGTVDEVQQEVIDNLRILGDGGGYILAPCHNIQAVSPPENIVAMCETAYELSRSS